MEKQKNVPSAALSTVDKCEKKDNTEHEDQVKTDPLLAYEEAINWIKERFF